MVPNLGTWPFQEHNIMMLYMAYTCPLSSVDCYPRRCIRNSTLFIIHVNYIIKYNVPYKTI